MPSTPHDPSEAVLNGIAKVKVLAQAQGREFAFVLNHGTTVATNAILEGKGAKVCDISDSFSVLVFPFFLSLFHRTLSINQSERLLTGLHLYIPHIR